MKKAKNEIFEVIKKLYYLSFSLMIFILLHLFLPFLLLLLLSSDLFVLPFAELEHHNLILFNGCAKFECAKLRGRER